MQAMVGEGSVLQLTTTTLCETLVSSSGHSSSRLLFETPAHIDSALWVREPSTHRHGQPRLKSLARDVSEKWLLVRRGSWRSQLSLCDHHDLFHCVRPPVLDHLRLASEHHPMWPS